MGSPFSHQADYLINCLLNEGTTFELFQAIRLLDRLVKEPNDIHFRTDPSLAASAIELASVSRNRQDEEWELFTRTAGLIGARGVLPFWYTELVIDRNAVSDWGIGCFFDLFSNVLTRLEYEGWVQSKVCVQYEREKLRGESPFTSSLRSLVGIRDGVMSYVPDTDLLYYAGIAGRRPAPAVSIQRVLADYLDASVKIIESTGGWYLLPVDRRLQLGDAAGRTRVGEGAILGDTVHARQCAFRVEIRGVGPDRIADFLPGGKACSAAIELTSFLAGDSIFFDLDLLLDGHEFGSIPLGVGDTESMLGVNVWLGGNDSDLPGSIRLYSCSIGQVIGTARG